MDLAAYQDAFAAALLADGAEASPSPVVERLRRQPGFAVYRNTVLKGCIDALQANFPTVERLVGEEWLRAAAGVFARGQLPSQPSLLLYGEAFPSFLAAFGPAQEIPYLADVARVDRLWTEAHVAADAPVFKAAELAALPPSAMSSSAFCLHPAALRCALGILNEDAALGAGLGILLFYVVALQCVATVATLKAETGNNKLVIGVVVAYGLLAYLLAAITYNLVG